MMAPCSSTTRTVSSNGPILFIFFLVSGIMLQQQEIEQMLLSKKQRRQGHGTMVVAVLPQNLETWGQIRTGEKAQLRRLRKEDCLNPRV
jgi:hypothetical protein